MLKLQARAGALFWFLLNNQMENPNFIFSSGPVELKEEGENFFVEGHISTSDLDLVNDIVTKDCIMDMAEQMRERTIKLDVEHESFKGDTDLEREINKTIIPAAKIDDFLIDKKGLKVRAMLNKHVNRFNEVKNSIRDGFLDAFSIAFVPVESKNEIREGHEVRMLNKINLLNVAFTGNPVNTSSTMTNVFAKSLEFLEEKEGLKKPKPQPDPHKEPEDEDEEEEKEKGPGGHKPDKTGPHGRGAGPGGGRADGSGIKKEKKNNHSVDKIKLQEVKNMAEDNKETDEEKEEVEEKKEPEAEEKSETEKKDEPEEEKKEEVKDEEPGEEEEKPEEEEDSDVEAKDIESLKKDMLEVKAVLKRPLLKSKVEQVNKTGIKEGKSLNPLDVIA